MAYATIDATDRATNSVTRAVENYPIDPAVNQHLTDAVFEARKLFPHGKFDLLIRVTENPV